MKKTRSQKIRSKKTNKTKKIIMFKNRPLNKSIPALMLTIILLWSYTSGAIFKKNTFVAAMSTMAYPTFKQLIKKETIDEQELKLFYRGRFEDIVKNNIKNSEPYTRCLGLKITNNDKLTMDRLPTTDEEGEKIAVLFAQLYQDQSNTNLLSKVQDFYKGKINVTKSADPFFPEIVVKSKSELIEHFKKLNNVTSAPKELNALFDPTLMKIIVTKEGLGLENCHVMFHEFTHLRQLRHGLELCAGYYRTLKKPTLPLALAMELEAEFNAIHGHPNKKYLLNQYEKKLSKATYQDQKAMIKEVQANFPYFTAPFSCGYLATNFGLKLDPKLEKTVKEGTELFFMMIGMAIQKQKAMIEKEKNGTKIFGMGGTDYPEKVFKLKEKFGLNPKE